MNKAKFFVLGMSLGFNRDHEIFEGIDFDEDMADMLLEGGKLSKEDVFSVAPNGKCIFEYKETWEKLDKVISLIGKNGETLSYNDLTAPIKDETSAIDMAAACESVASVLEPVLWKDRLEEFEEFFFSIDKAKRNSINFDDVKEKIAGISGIKTRLAELKELDIDPTRIRTDFNSGDLDKLLEEMAEKGTHLKVDDIKFVDADGDHMLYSKASWEKFEKIHEALMAAGETLDEDFFFFNRGNRKTVVESAFQHDSSSKIFNADVFKGRPDLLMTVYDSLDDSKKLKVDIDKVLMDVIESQVNMDFLVSEKIQTSDLLAPLFNEAASDTPVIALGLEKTWANMDKVAANLKENGQSITLEDMRQVSGKGSESCLIKAAKYGHFDKVMKLVKDNGEYLSVHDILDKPKDGESLLDVIQDKDSIDVLLDASYWAGRSDELIRIIWQNLDTSTQAKYQDDFRDLLTDCNIQALRREPSAPKIS